jgi:hypothetical protein
MLEAVTKSLPEELAARCAATDEKFAMLEKSVKNESAAIRAELGANQAALIVLLTPRHQSVDLPAAPTMPAMRSAASTSVELPPSPNLATGLNEATGGIPPPVIPPETGGLLFSNLSAPRNEEVETDAQFRARLAKEAKNFLRGRIQGENPYEYQHRVAMRLALGAAFCEHATTASGDTSPVG